MAVQPDSGGKDDVKTQFVTREGTYRLMTLSEYSRPNRVGYTSGAGSSHVRVSLVSLPPGPGNGAPGSDGQGSDDRICFNHGKELYVYVYRGVKKVLVFLISRKEFVLMNLVNIEKVVPYEVPKN